MTNVSATAAKNEFGRILDVVARGGSVTIRKRDQAVAVVIPKSEYDAMAAGREAALQRFHAEYDAMFERMQSQDARAAVRRFFRMTPDEIATAAVKAARRRAR